MTPTDLSARMRATFEAALPSDDAAVRRVAAQRAQRVAAQSSSVPRAGEARARALWARQPMLAFACAGVVVGLGLLLLWPVLQPEPVAIGPSLTRDLAAQGKDQEQKTTKAAREPERASTERAVADKAATGTARSPRPEGRKDAALLGKSAPEAPAADSTDARWAHVSAAMRKQDWAGAELALEPLIQSTDPETRDGARLVRIRLQLRKATTAGRDPIWLEELSDLATSGSTSSIRASARRLLDTSLGTSTKDGQTNHLEGAGELPPAEK